MTIITTCSCGSQQIAVIYLGDPLCEACWRALCNDDEQPATGANNTGQMVLL